MNEKVTILCTPLVFYTQNDEDLLFEWLKKIKSVVDFKGIGEELHLYISSSKIPNNDLLDLMAIFDRYKFDEKQLKVFMNESNKEWFEN